MERIKKPYKRSIIFIKKHMQLKFVFLSLLLALLCVVMCTYEFVSMIQAFFKAHPVLLLELMEQSSVLIPISLMKLAIFFAVIAILAAILSNRIAGPIYRFESVCKEVAKGNYKVRVKLRDGDGLRSLEKEFNAMLDSLERKEGESKNEK
ncbi:HAMP domain-containing protein [Candidatus Proelusimicrobium volucris]|uniref:HAMP domain-containing protein n=1 Tax=Candidatus Proelusimicrobium volucris TaxID=3416225 RepID=UPI003D0CE250